MSRHQYFLSIDDLAHARGVEPKLSYQGAGPNDFAAELEEALRYQGLFERWRALQPNPDQVDPALGATDPQVSVRAAQVDLHTEVVLLTQLPMSIVRHRLNMLIGPAWQLRDMRAA